MYKAKAPTIYIYTEDSTENVRNCMAAFKEAEKKIFNFCRLGEKEDKETCPNYWDWDYKNRRFILYGVLPYLDRIKAIFDKNHINYYITFRRTLDYEF